MEKRGDIEPGRTPVGNSVAKAAAADSPGWSRAITQVDPEFREGMKRIAGYVDDVFDADLTRRAAELAKGRPKAG